MTRDYAPLADDELEQKNCTCPQLTSCSNGKTTYYKAVDEKCDYLVAYGCKGTTTGSRVDFGNRH